MQRYDSYKPSGVEWIGQIPSHWEVRRLKHVVSCNDEVLSEMTPPWSVINYVEISDVTYINGIKGSTEYEFKDAPSRARRITRVNDVIISTVRTYLKAVARVNEPDVIVSTGFAVLRAQSIDDLYLSYVVKSSGFIDDVVANSVGVTYPSITASKLMSLSLPLPLLEEQERIAEYLDRKCAEIDGIINKEEQAIALLDELKQTMISEAVTRGLDPAVPLKSSGVDWIGNVPSHWQYGRIKYMLSRSSAGVWGEDALANEDDIICYRVADFDYNYGILNQDNITYRNIQSKQLVGRLVSKGDLLVEKSGGGETTPVGRVVRVNFSDKATCSNFIHSLSVNSKNNSSFLFYYFHQLYSKRTNLLFFNQTTGIQNLQIDRYLSQGLYLPPLEEQERIAEYLDKRCAEIDEAKERKQRQIELLREMKQIMISDAVTGRVKVF